MFSSLDEDFKMQDLGTHIPRSMFTALVRSGGLDDRVMDISFSGSQQCDASEFLERLRVAWYQEEVDRAGSLAREPGKAELDFVDSARTVLREFVWGLLIRSRIFCKSCGVASDKIYYDHNDILKLELPSDGSACRLEELICRYSRPDEDKTLLCPAPSNLQCPKATAQVTRQYFIEKEPSVLFMQLQRGQQRGRQKWNYKILLCSPKSLHACVQGIIISRLLYVTKAHIFIQGITV